LSLFLFLSLPPFPISHHSPPSLSLCTAAPPPLSCRYRTEGGVKPDCPRIRFDPPRLSLGRAGRLGLSAGPATEVYLDTTYLDPALRIGKSLRSGARFVFPRLPAAARAPGAPPDAWRALLAAPPVPGRALALWAAAAAAAAAAYALGGGGAAAAGGALAPGGGGAGRVARRALLAAAPLVLLPVAAALLFAFFN
jgi:hypothetical protein